MAVATKSLGMVCPFSSKTGCPSLVSLWWMATNEPLAEMVTLLTSMFLSRLSQMGFSCRLFRLSAPSSFTRLRSSFRMLGSTTLSILSVLSMALRVVYSFSRVTSVTLRGTARLWSSLSQMGLFSRLCFPVKAFLGSPPKASSRFCRASR